MDLTIVIVIIVIFSIITMKARTPHIIGKCYMKMRAGFKTISFETYVVFCPLQKREIVKLYYELFSWQGNRRSFH